MSRTPIDKAVHPVAVCVVVYSTVALCGYTPTSHAALTLDRYAN